MAQERTVVYGNNEIHYLLEQKQVKNLNLRVHKDCMVYVSANPDVPAEKVDDFVHLCVKDTENFAKKQKMVTRYLDEQCRSIFGEIILETYPVFQKYGVPMPELRIRNMETRWGSCLAKKGIVTLNKRLLEAPRNCIEYVVMHEFCHFVHPNHSKQFYAFLTMLMPDWKQRKETLDKSATFWL